MVIPPLPFFDHNALFAAAARTFGDLLHVTGYESANQYDRSVIDLHLHDLIRIPPSVSERVVDDGLRGIFIGTGAVPDLDDMGFLRTLQPIAWRPSATYANVPAAYDRTRKFVVVGTVGLNPHEQHNLLHEFGHAIGDLSGLNDALELLTRHQDVRFWIRLPPYFRGAIPGDPRGRREILAELFRDRILNREAALERWGSELVAWLERELDFT